MAFFMRCLRATVCCIFVSFSGFFQEFCTDSVRRHYAGHTRQASISTARNRVDSGRHMIDYGSILAPRLSRRKAFKRGYLFSSAATRMKEGATATNVLIGVEKA
jgi:hypothetical protein